MASTKYSVCIDVEKHNKYIDRWVLAQKEREYLTCEGLTHKHPKNEELIDVHIRSLRERGHEQLLELVDKERPEKKQIKFNFTDRSCLVAHIVQINRTGAIIKNQNGNIEGIDFVDTESVEIVESELTDSDIKLFHSNYSLEQAGREWKEEQERKERQRKDPIPTHYGN